MIEIVKFNKIFSQLRCTDAQLNKIRASLTTVDAKARFKKYGTGLICPVTAFGNFDTPLLFEVVKAIKETLPGEEFKIAPEVLRTAAPRLNDCQLQMPLNGKIKPYEHQLAAAKAFLNFGRGIVEVPTRGGKSLIIYLVVRSVFTQREAMKNALLVVPNTQLVLQMANDFKNYGLDGLFDVVTFSAKTSQLPNEVCPHRLIISNSQFLRFHANELPGKIDLLMIDEAHKCGSKTWFTQFAKKFETNYRFGCTATIPDDVEQAWSIKKVFGSIVSRAEAPELIKSGLIAKPKISVLQIRYSPLPDLNVVGEDEDFGEQVVDPQVNKYNIECDWLSTEPMFNSICGQLISRYSSGNCLVLFDRTAAGQAIFRVIQSDKKLYLDGETPLKKRLEITNAMNYNQGFKLVANSACLGVGVTMKSVSAVFVLNIRSANTAILQQVGRALMVEEGKSETQIIDISTNLRYSKKHAEKRLDLYERVYQVQIAKNDVKTLRVDLNH